MLHECRHGSTEPLNQWEDVPQTQKLCEGPSSILGNAWLDLLAANHFSLTLCHLSFSSELFAFCLRSNFMFLIFDSYLTDV